MTLLRNSFLLGNYMYHIFYDMKGNITNVLVSDNKMEIIYNYAEDIKEKINKE